MNLRAPAIALGVIVLSGCFFVIGNEKKPIETLVVPGAGTEPAADAVIVLPGFGADAEKLKEHHVDEAIHRSWPQADVVLVSATFAYYAHNVFLPHFEQDVMAPALQRYRRIWLAGASVGGMGAILYEREHPGLVSGLILFAPWLGSKDTLEAVRAAGVQHWDPGPKPEHVDGKNFENEMWREIRDWSLDPAEAKRVWLVCGDKDKFLEADRMLAAALPDQHYLEVPGGHTYDTWLSAAEEIIGRVRAAAVGRVGPATEKPAS